MGGRMVLVVASAGRAGAAAGPCAASATAMLPTVMVRHAEIDACVPAGSMKLTHTVASPAALGFGV